MNTYWIVSKINRIVDIILRRNKVSVETMTTNGMENPNKVFYVVRRSDENVGIFSYVLTGLGHIDRARKNKWIPIIDMENIKNPYLDEKKLHKENAWEYFFEQPEDYHLENINDSKNIILSQGGPPEKYPTSNTLFDENELKYWQEVFEKNIKIKSAIMNKADKEWRKINPGNESICAMNCRGTDYWNLKPFGHPIQPNMQQLLKKAQEILSRGDFNKIYLSTEDLDIVNEFKNRFGDKVITMNRFFVSGKKLENKLITTVHENSNNEIEQGIEYLVSVILLTKCDGIVAAGCGSSIAAFLMHNNWRYQYIWNLGLYE